MHVERNIKERTMLITQKYYVEKLLSRFGMEDCKPVLTPIECNLKLSKGTEKDRTEKPHRELVGCIAYLAHTSRPDLCAAINFFSQLQNCPTDEHWKHLKRILRYLKGTMNIGLEYVGNDSNSELEIFCDADWGNNINDRKSLSGYIVRVYGATVSWRTRKQSTVALSSTEAELIAFCTATTEAAWLRRLLKDLDINVSGSVTIFEDNQSCLQLAEGKVESRRMKHIDIKYNYIQEQIQAGHIKAVYVPSKLQLADIMTKELPASEFKQLSEKIGHKG